MDATALARSLGALPEDTLFYLDPPYNQHPYGSNYHVLNTVTLWDRPPLSRRIEGRNKAAIRSDWRSQRRSAYNYRHSAPDALRELIAAIPSRHVLLSYSTDGMVPLEEVVAVALEAGRVEVVRAPYKRYRVSPTRRSPKPLTVEFVLVLTKGEWRGGASAAELVARIRQVEESALGGHPERG